MNCKDCVYYKPRMGAGQCRKSPPVVTEASSRWPIVEEFDWCGEFKEKEDPYKGAI